MKSKLLIAGLLFLNVAVRSQVAVTNTGVLYIKTGSDIFYTSGDFTNASSAALTNNGSLYIKGNVINDQASMSIGTGTTILNGSSMQTISGTQIFKVYNLTTSNAAGIQINANLSVSGVHTFSAGVISTSSTPNYIVYESGSSYTGASDAKHVNGWVKKIGNTDFSFPTGNGTYLREIGLSNLAGSSEFDVRYSGGTYDVNSVQNPIVSMNPGEHWTINEISGGSAKVQLNWDNSKVGFPEYALADLRAAVYSGGQWTNAGGSASGSVTTTGSISSNSISSFGRLAIGSISFPLPLKFVGISATLENSSVQVKWQTANEEGVQNYNVQKSPDGINYTTITTINAANNNAFQTYQFSDQDVSSSKLYYRVRANDFDGKSMYSKVVAITADRIQRIQLITNPVKEFIQLGTQNLPRSVYAYQLINAAGQICKKGSLICEGSSYVSVPVHQILPGQYTLVLTKRDESKQFKVLIQ